jgi:hypothetical protein
MISIQAMPVNFIEKNRTIVLGLLACGLCTLALQQQQQADAIELSADSSTPAPSRAPQLLATNNSLPIADGGHSRADQVVKEGSLVKLDGSASHDPDVDPLTFPWTQLSGSPIALSTPNQAKTNFTAQSNLINDIELGFKLTVADTAGLSDSDTASIVVRHTATPPPPPPPPPPPSAPPSSCPRMPGCCWCI